MKNICIIMYTISKYKASSIVFKALSIICMAVVFLSFYYISLSDKLFELYLEFLGTAD